MRNKIADTVKISALSACICLSACGKKPVEEVDLAKTSLGAVRSALQVYYADHEGKFPGTLTELALDGRYLKAIPEVKLPGHPATSAVIYIAAPSVNPKSLTDSGGFAYYNSDKYPDTKGIVLLNCTHASLWD